MHLAVHPSDVRVLAAATRRGVYLSTDGGVSWWRVFRTGFGGSSLDGVVSEESETVSTDQEKRSRSGATSSVVGVALGRRTLLVATQRGLFSGPLIGPLQRDRGLMRSSSIHAVARWRGKKDRFVAAVGRRLWAKVSGEWGPVSPILEETIRGLALGPGASQSLAVIGEKNLFISSDRGKSFARVALTARPKSVALAARRGAGVLFSVTSSLGVEVGHGRSGTYKVRKKKATGGALAGVVGNPSGRPESFLYWGTSAWISRKGPLKWVRSFGLVGTPRVGVFLPTRRTRPPRALVATANGLFEGVWTRLRRPRNRSGHPKGRRRKKTECAFPQRGAEETLLLSGSAMSLRARVQRRWWAPTVSLTYESQRRSSGVGETVRNEWDHRVWLSLSWPLGTVPVAPGAVGRPTRAVRTRLRRLQGERVQRVKTCRQLQALLKRACGLSPIQRAALELQLQEVRAKLARPL